MVFSEHGVHYMLGIYSEHFPVLEWETKVCDACVHLSALVTVVFLLIIGTVLIRSNSGQLMLVSPQQAVTGAKTTSNVVTPRPAVPVNTPTVKICTVPVIYLHFLSLQPLSSYKRGHVRQKKFEIILPNF